MIDRSGVGIPTDAQVRNRPTSIFIPYVALADVTGQKENFLCRVKSAGLAKSHLPFRPDDYSTVARRDTYFLRFAGVNRLPPAGNVPSVTCLHRVLCGRPIQEGSTWQIT
jgi:hypothetical protein